MDSSSHTAAVDSEIVKENYFAAAAELIIETTCRADAWIRQHTEPLLNRNYSRKLRHSRLRNHHRNFYKSRRMDSSAHKAPVDSQIVKENEIDAEEIITETACKADAYIRQCTQPLFTQKYSRKTELPPTQKS